MLTHALCKSVVKTANARFCLADVAKPQFASALQDRVKAHWQDGANHVCIQALQDGSMSGPDMTLLELMAPLNR